MDSAGGSAGEGRASLDAPEVGLTLLVESSGVTLESAGGEALGLALRAWGPAAAPVVVGSGVVEGGGAAGDGLTLSWPGLTEWWVSRPDGLEQGYTVETLPPGDHLVFDLDVTGADVGLTRMGARFRLADDTVLHYRGLVVTDAEGRRLPATLARIPGGLRIDVVTTGAVAPLLVDPLVSPYVASWIGTTAGMQLGYALAGVGDVNGDGFGDFAVGAPRFNSFTGAVEVYYGSASGPGATADQTLSGPAAASFFGAAVDGGGDLNGDGYDDVVVGAYGYNASEGVVSVYLGGPSGLSGTAATTLPGGTSGTYFGYAVACIGDVTGDGFGDVAIGAPYSSGLLGNVYIYPGSSTGLRPTPVLTLGGAAANERFGAAISGAGDVNGDGHRDVVIGGPGGAGGFGLVRVFHGNGSTLEFTPAITITGPTSGSQFGSRVAGVGDASQDGYDDIVVGASAYLFNTGQTTYYMGSTSGIGGTAAVTWAGVAVGDYMGSAVGGAGDIDADGDADVIVSAYGSPGRVELHLGAAGGPGTASDQGITADGATGNFGEALDGVGDVNGDGYDDVLVSNPYLLSSTGAVYLYTGYLDGDGDGSLSREDCDDTDPGVFPGAIEQCNGTDDDCDGTVDEDAVDASTWYADADRDGYGDLASTTLACRVPFGFVADATDCADGVPEVHPGADEVCNGVDDNCDTVVDTDAIDAPTWYRDEDGDGYGNAAASVMSCVAPEGTLADATDCDDSAAAVHPGATEVCNRRDDNCDTIVDTDAVDAPTWYADADTDAYGDPATAVVACVAPAGAISDGSDCDDTRADVYPGATERCDGVDDNCDGDVDEATAEDAATWYYDADADGYGDLAITLPACTQPDGYAAVDGDCADDEAAIHPGQMERCNGVDDDCNALTDIEDPAVVDAGTWYTDADADGYGDPAAPVTACTQPKATVVDATDCDDAAAAVFPTATELCNAIDDDCDGAVDEEASDVVTWYADADGDGYGDAGVFVTACTQPAETVADGSDCDDTEATIYPGAAEVCDEKDDDCDTEVDEDATDASTWYADTDGDGYGDADSPAAACSQPAGYVANADDCDDVVANVEPCGSGDTDDSGRLDLDDKQDGCGCASGGGGGLAAGLIGLLGVLGRRRPAR